MLKPADLPTWMTKGIDAIPNLRKEAIAILNQNITKYRGESSKLTYDDLRYFLYVEFTTRNRPRKWIVTAVIGRLNTIRNAEYAESISHLKTWEFKS